MTKKIITVFIFTIVLTNTTIAQILNVVNSGLANPNPNSKELVKFTYTLTGLPTGVTFNSIYYEFQNGCSDCILNYWEKSVDVNATNATGYFYLPCGPNRMYKFKAKLSNNQEIVMTGTVTATCNSSILCTTNYINITNGSYNKPNIRFIGNAITDPTQPSGSPKYKLFVRRPNGYEYCLYNCNNVLSPNYLEFTDSQAECGNNTYILKRQLTTSSQFVTIAVCSKLVHN